VAALIEHQAELIHGWSPVRAISNDQHLSPHATDRPIGGAESPRRAIRLGVSPGRWTRFLARTARRGLGRGHALRDGEQVRVDDRDDLTERVGDQVGLSRYDLVDGVAHAGRPPTTTIVCPVTLIWGS
jgi:hypothetical protein